MRVLLVEDDPNTVALVTMGLGYEGFDVAVATSGHEGLATALRDPPDLVILDQMLPGMDGLEVLRRLRAVADVPVLILTARDAVDDRIRGLDAGADDYLVKPFAFSELVARVRARLRGRLGRESLVFADVVVDPGAFEAARGRRRLDLTATEVRLLAFFVRHARHVLSKEQILDAVWGYAGGNENVVEQYVHSLRRKMGEPQLIQTVRFAGYILREPTL